MKQRRRNRGRRPSVRRERPAFLWMLAGIVALYVVIIGFGDEDSSNPVRALLLGALVWNAIRVRAGSRARRWAVVIALTAVITTTLAVLTGNPRLEAAVSGAWSFVLAGSTILAIAWTIRRRLVVNIATVLAVLCIYLLFALFFAGLHQTLAAFSHDYLNGAGDPPSASALLYFSVITMATVGFGDITPVSNLARAVTVVEALTGQLYLVSVVAAVVGGWRSGGSAGDRPA